MFCELWVRLCANIDQLELDFASRSVLAYVRLLQSSGSQTSHLALDFHNQRKIKRKQRELKENKIIC